MKHLVFFFLFVFFIGSCESSDNPEKSEQSDVVKLYNMHCGICHGKDGRKGLAGAKVLPESDLSLNERIAIITNGKGQMMPYKNILSESDIKAIAEYTLSFK